MTALNQTYTTEYNLQTGPRRVPAGSVDEGPRNAMVRENYVTGIGTVNVIILPAGNIRVFRDGSRLSTENATWTTGGITLVVGFAAYTDGATGLVVTAVANAFITSQTPAAGALDLSFASGLGVGILFQDFNTQNGLTITYTTATQNKAAADIFNLVVAYQFIGMGT